MSAADLIQFIAESLARPVPQEIKAMAEEVRKRHRNVAAILAYGSCLRGVSTEESLIDLYVLTADLEGVSTSALGRLACALAPPNVHYAETEHQGRMLRAKYAVLPLPLFDRRMRAANPYFWARFSQPAALLYGEAAPVGRAIAAGAQTMFAHARGLSSASDPLQVWADGFASTYATELRAEGGSRAAMLVTADKQYYRRLTELLGDVQPLKANWPLRRLTGKLWSVARLSKAAFTFAGGADYIVWKIERHSGHRITLSPWQRRHPILTGLILLPQLLRKGAVR